MTSLLQLEHTEDVDIMKYDMSDEVMSSGTTWGTCLRTETRTKSITMSRIIVSQSQSVTRSGTDTTDVRGSHRQGLEITDRTYR